MIYLEAVGVGLFVFAATYLGGYVFARGWHAAGKYATVCDVCFRDIRRVNKVLARKKTNPSKK